ncbi:ring-cleaving dioxygenase [Sporosarcina sp. HYO08]|uniref:ring-cleaving dioxygenase n=1 Tax=Sporosarcina sp. HYO08 TaxID=1759557 RepID=UPI000799ABF5|nr:ring-cleaving dioxygenase [Sporosarcina sp. HYO08]KXH83762.1 glyoxalase [Sporosarcina sp. HYO08]
MYNIPGHHHISMITKNAQANNHFYQNILGLRRVKKTVNQDDPSMYHLFFGDQTGSPGTELTFFEIPMAGGTVRGTNAITQIGLLVPTSESLDYWEAHLAQFGVKMSERTTYVGYEALPFEDPEGLRLILLNHNGQAIPSDWTAWEDSEVEPEHRILGMGPIEITVRRLGKTANTIQHLLRFKEVSKTASEIIFRAVEGESFGEIVLKQQDGPTEKPGRGSVHHLALRVKNEEELQYWAKKVEARGFQSSGIVERFYFKSLYFRESNGILFELATDEPGFTVDSTIENLGQQLDLPPFLEEKRAEIEGKLKLIE